MPLGHRLDAASPAAVKLVAATLATMAVPRRGRGRPRKRPERRISDQACDSDALRQRVAKRALS